MSQTTVYANGVPSHVYDSTTGVSSPVPANASQATQAADAKTASSEVTQKQNAGILPVNGVGGTVATPTTAPPTTSTNTPVSTAQPSPTTVAVTPASATTSATTSAPAVVSAAQAQANLKAGGLSGSDLTNAQSALNAYQQGHAATQASGVPAPQDAGTGMSDATQTAGSTTQTYAPTPEVQDAVAQATQKYTDDYAKAMTSQSQTETLVQQYEDLSNQLGIPALNTELMNMNNVINGTEDDIRNEVTKAGGFATDSQVLAMTNSRNKVMIQNYNNLLQTKSDAMQQLTTLSGLAAQDRQFAADQLDKQLNFDQQQITFATNAQTNAQNSIQKSIDNYGAASVYQQALATGDPTAVARINATMGNGFDLATAAQNPTLAEQAQTANIAQSYAAIRASDSTVAKNNYDMSGAGNTNDILNAVTKQNALQNAGDSQTVNSNYESIQSLFPAGTDLSKVTAKDVSKLTAAQQTTIGKALSRIQNPDLARGAAGPVDALAAVGLPGQISEGVGQFLTGKPYDDAKVAQAVNTAAQLVSQRNGQNTQAAPQPVLAPQEIPSGYYQASDGLLYKK